jgi:hypothetical protein
VAATGTVSTGKATGGGSATSTNGATRATSVSTPLPAMTEARWQALSVQSVPILRQVLVPIHLEGYTTTETAKRIGIPVGSVRLLVDYFANEVSELGGCPPISFSV